MSNLSILSCARKINVCINTTRAPHSTFSYVIDCRRWSRPFFAYLQKPWFFWKPTSDISRCSRQNGTEFRQLVAVITTASQFLSMNDRDWWCSSWFWPHVKQWGLSLTKVGEHERTTGEAAIATTSLFRELDWEYGENWGLSISHLASLSSSRLHQLGRSRHPLPCGSGQLYNWLAIVTKGIPNTANAFFGY